MPLMIGAGGVLVAVLAVLLFARPREPAGVAVLRPAVPAGDASLAQVGLGIVGEIESALQKMGHVRMVSDGSVEALRTAGKTAKQIADSLHVTYLVQGTVQSDGQTARITMQVVNAAQDNVIWSESYDYAMGQLLTGEREIAAKVAAAVGGKAKR
jgi:TolB-like protein